MRPYRLYNSILAVKFLLNSPDVKFNKTNFPQHQVYKR
jgi:hypothetical protein